MKLIGFNIVFSSMYVNLGVWLCILCVPSIFLYYFPSDNHQCLVLLRQLVVCVWSVINSSEVDLDFWKINKKGQENKLSERNWLPSQIISAQLSYQNSIKT